jgi:hypothetical protein
MDACFRELEPHDFKTSELIGTPLLCEVVFHKGRSRVSDVHSIGCT